MPWLYARNRVFESRLNGGWVLFAPDRPGLPVVVDQGTHSLLRRFDGGATVDEVASVLRREDSSTEDRDHVAALASFLHGRGFLRDGPEPAHYRGVDPQGGDATSFGVWLHISNRCNLDCAYCFVRKTDSVMNDGVAAATVRRIAATARSRKVESVIVNYAGGEPTLVIERVERFHRLLMAELDGSGIHVDAGILSNGTIVTDRLVSFLERHRIGLGISLDGHGPGHDIHRTFKGTERGSWGVITENIRRLKHRGIRPTILATISEDSCASLPRLAEWVSDEGLSLRLQPVRQPRRSWNRSDGCAEDYEPLVDRLIEAFDQAFEVLEDASHSPDLGQDLSLAELTFDQPTFSCCCGIGSTYVVINERGYVAPCPMALHDRAVRPGADLLEATRTAYPGSATPGPRHRDPRCLDCRWFPVCAGGCPMTNQRVLGNAFAMSPLHRFYDFVIPRYITFFGTKLLQDARRRNITDFNVLHHGTKPAERLAFRILHR